jgi:hypothetical protein
MTLIKCAECGREISDKAIACPHCGCPQAGGYPPPIPPRFGAPALLTNPKLPRMANLICIYCLGVSPALTILSLPWTFSDASSVGSASPAFALTLLWDLVAFAIDTTVTVILFLSGLKLKRLQASARRWVTLALYGSLGSATVLVVGSMFVWAIAAAIGPQASTSNDFTAGEVLLISLALIVLVFEIVAVVWLHRHGHELPLDKGGLH